VDLSKDQDRLIQPRIALLSRICPVAEEKGITVCAPVRFPPDSPQADRALYHLGTLHAEKQEPDWAASHDQFAKLVAMYQQRREQNADAPAPFLDHARHGMARALRKQGKLEESAELLKQVIAAVPDGEKLNARALLDLAHIHYTQGRMGDARDIFGRVGLLFDDPDLTPEALYWAGRATAETGEVIEGARLWALLLRSYPKTSWAEYAAKELKNRGIVLDEKGKVKE
jgi:tetratricopeptide (TPR) repeat protein